MNWNNLILTMSRCDMRILALKGLSLHEPLPLTRPRRLTRAPPSYTTSTTYTSPSLLHDLDDLHEPLPLTRPRRLTRAPPSYTPRRLTRTPLLLHTTSTLHTTFTLHTTSTLHMTSTLHTTFTLHMTFSYTRGFPLIKDS